MSIYPLLQDLPAERLTLPAQRVHARRMEPIAERVASNVDAWRRRRGFSQERLAALSDMSQPALSRRLTGEVPFNLIELPAVCRALNVSVLELLAEEDVAAPTANLP